MGKKRKVKNKELTQEEIWDDSALIQSWDEAVEEYKLYHSIHARGENVEDVLREAATAAGGLAPEGAENGSHEAHLAGHNVNIPGAGEPEDGEVEDDDYTPVDTYAGEASQPHAMEDASSTAQPLHEAGNSGTSAARETANGGMSMPQTLLGEANDGGLKSLMMAWYFAGYYTGLYEGQQQANQRQSF